MASLPKQVTDNLTPGESVACCVQTSFDLNPTFIIVTNKRAIYFDKKMLGRYDMSGIPYSKISKVVGKKGKMRGSLTVIGEEKGMIINVEKLKNDQILQVIETIKNEINKVAIEPISIMRKKKLMGEEWYLHKPKENVVRNISAPAPHAMQSMDAPPSGIEQIRELKGLMDEGLITEEEFLAKKAEILGRM